MLSQATLFAGQPAALFDERDEREELDLSAHGVLRHFAALRRARLLNFLDAMDQSDHWAVDFAADAAPPSFDLQLYLQELADCVKASSAVLHLVPAELAALLAQLTSARSLYLIRYVARHNEQFLDALAAALERAGDDQPALAVLRQRFDAFCRAELLGEIFSSQRLHRIASIMENYKDE